MALHITSDWHIHSINSYDGHLPIRDVGQMMREKNIVNFKAYGRGLIPMMQEKGIVHFGVTDHFSTPRHLYDILNSCADFAEVQSSLPDSLDCHFGVETAAMPKKALEMLRQGQGDRNLGIIGELPYDDDDVDIVLTEEIVEKCRIEYVIGGVHRTYTLPEAQAIRSFHRQMLFLAGHPLITIMAHPWCYSGFWTIPNGKWDADPWFENFDKIPAALHDELAAAVRQNNKIVEISLPLLLREVYPDAFKQDYLNYLAYLKSKKIKFSIGSDCHGPNYAQDYSETDMDLRKAEALLSSVGFTDADIWCL